MSDTRAVKKFTIIVCFGCVMLASLPDRVFAQEKAVSFDQAISSSVRKLAELLEKNSKIAVYGFNVLEAIPDKDLSGYMTDETERYLLSHKSRGITLVERKDIEVAQKELNLQQTEEIDEKTAQSIGKKIGATVVITGTVRRLSGEYVIHVKAITVEKAVTIFNDKLNIKKDDSTLKDFFPPPDQKNYWFSLGGRGGAAIHLYKLSDDISGEADNPSLAVEPALQLAFHFNDFFALQTELALSMDKVSYSGNEPGAGEYTASFKSKSLRIPLLARFTYSNPDILGHFTFGGLAGINFLNIPIGAMELQSSLYSDSSYRFSIPFGYVAGMNIGWWFDDNHRHLLFSDIRFSGDILKTAIHDNSGTLALYSRNTLSFSVGYEFNFGK